MKDYEDFISTKCENCKFYRTEEDAEGKIYEYCDIYDCQLCEIGGLEPKKGCLYFSKTHSEYLQEKAYFEGIKKGQKTTAIFFLENYGYLLSKRVKDEIIYLYKIEEVINEEKTND